MNAVKILKKHGMKTLANYMDDDIREKVHAELAPCTEAQFVKRYAELHEEKFGEPFEIN